MERIDGRHDTHKTEEAGDEAAIHTQQVRAQDGKPPEPPNPDHFTLDSSGLPPEKRISALNELADYLTYQRDHFLGYQANQDMDAYQQDLSRFMTMSINNLGDPFSIGGYKVQTRVAERAVLDYFAKLWNGIPYNQTIADRESCWGYVLSMGSTEGNLYALWNARDYLAGKMLLIEPVMTKTRPVTYQDPKPHPSNPHAYKPVIFFSQDTHYSFTKAARALGLMTFTQLGREKYAHDCPLGGEWPDEVPSALPSKTGKDDQYPPFGPGSIDVDKLTKLVEFFAEKGYPIIVSLNYGSTFKGAYDDVQKVSDSLLPTFDKYGLVSRKVEYDPPSPAFDYRRGFWIHVDGALGAGYMPFLIKAEKAGKWTPPTSVPRFDFGVHSSLSSKPPVDMVSSIVVSGHKWMGCPWPCGVLMTKVKYQMNPPDSPGYIGAADTTFAGSRNGFSPIVLWDHIAQNSDDRQIEKCINSQELTGYLEKQLHTVEKYWRDKEEKPDLDLYIDRTPLAITVRFRKPNQDLVEKWSLSTVQNIKMRPGQPDKPDDPRDYAHVFVMRFTTQKIINDFIADLKTDRAFDWTPPQPTPTASPLVAKFPFADRGFA